MSATVPSEVFVTLGRAAEIGRLVARIDAWMEGAHPAIRPMLDQQFHGMIKYFRPLTIFGCHFALTRDPVPEHLMVTAHVVEMIHNVTLIIDDIVDRSDTRRGIPTLHPVYDELTAYMVAGYLVADAYDLLAREMVDEFLDMTGLDEETAHRRRETVDDRADSVAGAVDRGLLSVIDAVGLVRPSVRKSVNANGPVRFDMRLVSELIKRLAIAECVQWDNRKGGAVRRDKRRLAKPLGVTDWRFLAREDTGCMFEVCATLGARSQRFRRFGRLLGMLYHGCDDVADVKNSVRLGGGGEEDIRDRILTLPAALAIDADPALRRVFERDVPEAGDDARLARAFAEQLPNAELQLDEIQRQAVDEAVSLGVPFVDELIRLVEQVRPLSV